MENLKERLKIAGLGIEKILQRNDLNIVEAEIIKSNEGDDKLILYVDDMSKFQSSRHKIFIRAWSGR
jgi:hypothetical protein